jgi:hypothetical protein
MSPKIKIYYPFHPFFGKELEVVTKPRDRNGSLTVIDPHSNILKMPFWMTAEAASECHVSEIIELQIEALLSLNTFIKEQCKNRDLLSSSK